MSAYRDASVFTTLVLQDQGHEAVDTWIGGQREPPLYSNFGWGEFVSALGRRVRATGLAPEVGARVVLETAAYMRPWSFVTLVPSDVDDATSMIMDFSLALRLPDAIYLAIARRLDVALASTDQQQLRAAAVLGITAINPLTGRTT